MSTPSRFRGEAERIYEITDDSGFLGVFDPDNYESFVDEDWSLHQLLAHFKAEVAARHLLLWGTGREDNWLVLVRDRWTREAGFREVRGSVVASRKRLCLTSYEALTMGAQFQDVRLPQAHDEHLLLRVPSGMLGCRIVQLNSPDQDPPAHCEYDFLIELKRSTRGIASWKKLPWVDPRLGEDPR